MTEDELLRILHASPQLERLSLVQIRQTIPANGYQLPPKHVVRLPVLTFLKLDNDPKVVGYTLAHLDIPALASLDIHSRVSDWDIVRSLDHFFPDDRLPGRLFSDPPVFELGRPCLYEENPSLKFSIGSLKVQFDFNAYDAEASHNVTASCILLVPPSVTTIKLELAKLNVQEWKEFFRSHPEVRSIEYTELRGEPMSKSLWDALSPAEDDDQVVLCPRLESIVCNVNTGTERVKPLLISLSYRGSAGFKLRHLKMRGRWIYKIVGIIRPLVEVLEVDFPNKLEQKVSLISMQELGMR